MPFQMSDFNATLVREKIVFVADSGGENVDDTENTVIRSNRISFSLGEGSGAEKIVVRSQTMHTTLYLASKIIYSFYRSGFFIGRDPPCNWEAMWESIVASYEKDNNPNIWASVYINGKSVFTTTKSPFVDIVETCALLTESNYDATMGVAETFMKRAGKSMRVNHDTNVAAVFTDAGDAMKCAIIHRAGGHDTVLSFTAEGGVKDNRIHQSISVAAQLLEGMNLSFLVDKLRIQARRGEIPKISPEAKLLRAATSRLTSIDRGVSSFEEVYVMKYRPEKPMFFKNA